MKRHLDKDNALALLVVIATILALIFIPYWIGLFSYNHTPLQTPLFGTYEQIQEPAGDYYLTGNDTYIPVVGDYWSSGLLSIIIIIVIILTLLLIGYVFYSLFDWLFPETRG